jgi:hypothetical protein
MVVTWSSKRSLSEPPNGLSGLDAASRSGQKTESCWSLPFVFLPACAGSQEAVDDASGKGCGDKHLIAGVESCRFSVRHLGS